ncbi:MAG TPA: class I SAM-dependent methyltransferase, partial [Rubricoccaceae bacterium]
VFHERVLELVREAAPRTVLDAGCGEGFVAGFIGERMPGVEITGIDDSAGAVEYAREHFGAHGTFEVGSVYALPYADRQFDLVLCSEVLEHLDRPEEALAELKRVARRHVLLSVPLEPYFDGLNRLGRRLGVGGDPGHVNFWTRETWARWVHRHFEDVQTDTKLIYNLALARVG